MKKRAWQPQLSHLFNSSSNRADINSPHSGHSNIRSLFSITTSGRETETRRLNLRTFLWKPAEGVMVCRRSDFEGGSPQGRAYQCTPRSCCTRTLVGRETETTIARSRETKGWQSLISGKPQIARMKIAYFNPT